MNNQTVQINAFPYNLHENIDNACHLPLHVPKIKQCIKIAGNEVENTNVISTKAPTIIPIEHCNVLITYLQSDMYPNTTRDVTVNIAVLGGIIATNEYGIPQCNARLGACI